MLYFIVLYYTVILTFNILSFDCVRCLKKNINLNVIEILPGGEFLWWNLMLLLCYEKHEKSRYLLLLLSACVNMLIFLLFFFRKPTGEFSFSLLKTFAVCRYGSTMNGLLPRPWRQNGF